MFKIQNAFPDKTCPIDTGIHFAFQSSQDNCGIAQFNPHTGKEIRRFPFEEADRCGLIYMKDLKDIDSGNFAYMFYENDCYVPDIHGRMYHISPKKYGTEQTETDFIAGFTSAEFLWENDAFPQNSYQDSCFYLIHPRGFTKHSSSGIKHKGSFLGITEKIDYLKDIGITAIELQPSYEFMDCDSKHGFNYWGYRDSYYYAPKRAYCATKDPVYEFKTMVKSLHQSNIEIIMQLYFPIECNPNEIRDICRFWHYEYHVDGFHLIGESVQQDMLAADPLLSDAKLIYACFHNPHDNCAVADDAYLHALRKLLKGDPGYLQPALYQMRHIPKTGGKIHYLDHYYGFTLYDLVSYEHKHNEANGEFNQDGEDYNESWNCGEEGKSKSRKVIHTRQRQLYNAYLFLLLSQSTPMIVMGDEFGRTQLGNNNPYNQDNATTWVNWNLSEKNSHFLQLWKELIRFRREHKLLHPDCETRFCDSVNSGLPDISYHNESAWKFDFYNNYNTVGILLTGQNGDTSEKLYIAINMHWESHTLALPRIGQRSDWIVKFFTQEKTEEERNYRFSDIQIKMPPRSIMVLENQPENSNREISNREMK